MEHTSAANNYPFLAVGGEMGTLTRNHDWSTIALGTPDQWPSSLRTLVTMMLTSRFPMLIFWGPELTTFYNDAFRPSLGNNGKHPSSLGQRGEQSWAESWPVIGPMIDNIMASGGAVWFEDQKLPIYRDGQMGYAYWTYSFSPLTDDTGAVNGVLVTCSETTDAVLNRQKLEASENRFRSIINQTPAATMVLRGDDFVVEQINTPMLELIGQRETVVGQPLLSLMPELEHEFAWQQTQQVYHQDISYDGVEVPVTHSIGGLISNSFYNLAYRPLEEDGKITGVIQVVTDVTEQVLFRQAIADSEAKLRSLIEEAPVATGLFIGPEMIIDVANESMIRFFGKGKSILGKPIRAVLTETHDQGALQLLEEVFTTGKSFEAKGAPAKLTIDGIPGTYYFDLNLTPLRNGVGQVYAILEMAVDVTEQVLDRQKLKETETSLRGAVELAQLGTWSIDVATNGFTYSDRMIEWFGHDPGQHDYTGVIPILDAADQDRVARAVAWALNPESDGVYDEVYTVIHPQTGQKRILHAQGKTVFDATGKALRMNGTAQDITEQQQTQLALEQEVDQRTRQLQTLVQDLERSNENLQQFAYVAGHDLQEPLRKIQSFGDLLQSQYADQLGTGADHLQRMQVAANRMSTLIRDLLAYSRISTRQEAPESVPLMKVVEQAITDLDLLIKDTGAVIEVDPLPVVPGDASQLGQLFQNLLSNALKFRRANVPPVIDVHCQLVNADAVPPSVIPTRSAATYYQIDVADNGVGFDEKYVDRIFHVFQRLHGRNQYDGTGIGLAICEKVVANHGGAVTAHSQPGQGATFSVYLPTTNLSEQVHNR